MIPDAIKVIRLNKDQVFNQNKDSKLATGEQAQSIPASLLIKVH